MPQAADILRSVLDGLDELFLRTGVAFWDEQVRRVAAFESATAMARAYASMSQGSASGTFHDRIISVRNHDPITARQEPFVNELLTTFQSIGLACMNAVTADGDDAELGQSTADTASEYWLRWQGHDVASRWRKVVTGVRCRTCDSRYLLDDARDGVAALRWSLTTAPTWIEDGRSRQLVDAAMDPSGHADTRAQLEAVRPAFEAVGLPFIPLPYNRPDRGPNDRCSTCGADSWTTTHWLMAHDPPSLEPFAE
jgi:hypothetical protein